MRFSVVIASLLAPYRGAAHDREAKLLRAVASAQQQSFRDFEIVVVADGCNRTMELVKDAVGVRSFLIERGKLFGGGPRNKGIDEAKGDYIVYLDIDDLSEIGFKLLRDAGNLFVFNNKRYFVHLNYTRFSDRCVIKIETSVSENSVRTLVVHLIGLKNKSELLKLMSQLNIL